MEDDPELSAAPDSASRNLSRDIRLHSSPNRGQSICHVSYDTHANRMDTIILRDLKFDLAVGLDAWHRPGKPQPVSLTINLQPRPNFEAAALQDDVNLTLDYGKLYKSVSATIKEKQYGNIQGLMLDLAMTVDGYKLLNVDIVLPKAVLRVNDGLHYHLRIDRSVPEKIDATWSLAIKKMTCACIIGVNPHERLHKQTLYFDVVLGGVQILESNIDANAVADAGLHDMVSHLIKRVEGSSYQTPWEALATAVAQVVTMDYGQPVVTVVVEKPNAIASIDAAVIQITRSRIFFENKDFWKVKRP